MFHTWYIYTQTHTNTYIHICFDTRAVIHSFFIKQTGFIVTLPILLIPKSNWQCSLLIVYPTPLLVNKIEFIKPGITLIKSVYSSVHKHFLHLSIIISITPGTYPREQSIHLITYHVNKYKPIQKCTQDKIITNMFTNS